MASSSTKSDNKVNDEVREYLRRDVVVVFKTREAFGGLSNMAAGFPLLVNNVRIYTSEALYQACRFPHLPEIQQLIIGQASPMTAKMRSKPYRIQTRTDWDSIKFKVMRWCLRVKLAQNFEKFSDLLLSTENKAIVEQSRKDDYWGAKLSADGERLVGQNVLGRLLMELRERLRQQEADSLTVVDPLAVVDFNLLGRPIEMVFPHRFGAKITDQPPLFE